MIAAVIGLMLAGTAAGATGGGTTHAAAPASDGIPAQLDAEQRAGYARVFQAIRESRWQDAQLALDAMKPGPLHAVARAELYLAHGSPHVEADALAQLVTQAPELPEAAELARLASARGAVDLPPLPAEQRLVTIAGASSRARAKAIKSDDTAATLSGAMQPFIKDDDGAGAQAVLEGTANLSPEATAEWQQRIGWMYYLRGDDANARTMEAKAATGEGEWAVQGRWVGALAAWRQGDCAAAGQGFVDVAARARDIELRAAGLFWAARADMACGRPDRIEARLKNAAEYRETFYGQLARQQLGIHDARSAPDRFVAADWTELAGRPNVRVAAALVEAGEDSLADQVIRHQAAIGDATEYPSLVRLAAKLNLPATTVWLSHNGPVGVTPPVAARYPAPDWAPDGGWRVDKALVLAHALQESRFRRDVVSPAGAYGLMQIMPSQARDYAKLHGGAAPDRAMLTKPSVNMELGQAYLEKLRDQSCTGGLLPKVIAAYNAGPTPVALWNTGAKDGGDPLLYIESIPYWETRGYVMTVLRNYWMYERQTGKPASPSRAALAQGLWPRFPGMPGPSAVRIATPKVAAGKQVASN